MGQQRGWGQLRGRGPGARRRRWLPPLLVVAGLVVLVGGVTLGSWRRIACSGSLAGCLPPAEPSTLWWPSTSCGGAGRGSMADDVIAGLVPGWAARAAMAAAPVRAAAHCARADGRPAARPGEACGQPG
jgi:hypothetical protein